jgi:hypothetical protein
MRPNLGFEPLLPLPQAVAFGLAAIALAVWLHRRRARTESGSTRKLTALTVLRATVVAILAMVLLNPVWTLASREAGKPPILVLLDTSHSMAVPDVGGESRFEAARRAVLDDSLLNALSKRYSPVYFGMAETASRAELGALRRAPKPTGESTHLGESLASAIASAGSARSGAMLIASDGRNNGEIDPVQIARQSRSRHFPVFTVCVGSQTKGKDVVLLNRRPQVYAAPEQSVPLMAEVRSIGYGGQSAQATLSKEGKPVAMKSVKLDDRRPVSVSFNTSEAKPGNYRFALSITPMPGEATAANNRCSVSLQVQEAHARVLVLEGRPTWDAKFLIQALHSDPAIQVDAIFKLADKKFFAVKGTPEPGAIPSQSVKVPSTPAELAKYDVVIIGKGYEEFYDEKSTAVLKQFVADHAGNVIFLRGKAAERDTALEALEPVRWSQEQIRDFRLQVTEEGVQNPAFGFRVGSDTRAIVQKLPKLISATRVEGEKALAVVLARAMDVPGGAQQKEMAVLAYQNYGQGKAVSLIGQGLWRWAFLPPELKDYAGCYNDFWTQLIRWLVNQSDFLPGQEVTLKTDRGTYSLGDSVNLLAYVRGKGIDAIPPVKITAPDGKSTEIRLAKAGGAQADFVGSYKPRVAGEYLASLTRPRAGPIMLPFSVYPDREEDIITAADPEMMRQIAQAGGGEALQINQLSELPGKLQEAQAMLVTHYDTKSAWDQSWVLGIILGLLSLEWALRRRWGLV